MFRPFSTRAKPATEQGGLIYDVFPQRLKNQVFQIWDEIVKRMPDVQFHGADVVYSGARDKVCHHLGQLRPLTQCPQSASQDLWEYFLNDADLSTCLDIIEIVRHSLLEMRRNDFAGVYFNLGREVQDAVTQMNARFQEHRVGYEFRDDGFIRIDSQFLHSEAVEPALELLTEPYLAFANQEFARAQQHHRHGLYAEAMNEALKAFESTMKAICHKRSWPYNQSDTAKKLLDACDDNGLFPSFMQSSLGGLRSALEVVATFRNRMSGHGQGVQPVTIDKDTASFVLNSTAANILFLVSREKRLP
jgi:hypothetical protein